jgi:hypothetical protein
MFGHTLYLCWWLAILQSPHSWMTGPRDRLMSILFHKYLCSFLYSVEHKKNLWFHTTLGINLWQRTHFSKKKKTVSFVEPRQCQHLFLLGREVLPPKSAHGTEIPRRVFGCLVFQLPPSWAGPTRISSAFAIGLYLRPRPRPSIGVIVWSAAALDFFL